MESNSNELPPQSPAGELDSAGCAPTHGSRVPTRDDAPLVDSSWDSDDGEDWDDPEDDGDEDSECGMMCDDGGSPVTCTLAGTEYCDFSCSNRAMLYRENASMEARER